MDAIKLAAGTESGPMSVLLRGGVVLLTLLTAAVHASLGGLLFTLNATVYVALAVAMILPAIAPYRWLARLALFGFASATIAGWVLFGARFPLAYIDKAIELALLCFLAIEVWLFDGGPAGDVRRVRRLVTRIAAMANARGDAR
jgi:hypothetical protein